MPKRGFSCLNQKIMHRNAKKKKVEITGTFHSISVELFKEPLNQKILHKNSKKSMFERSGHIKGKKLVFSTQSQKLLRRKALSTSRNPNPINDGERCLRFGNAPYVKEL